MSFFFISRHDLFYVFRWTYVDFENNIFFFYSICFLPNSVHYKFQYNSVQSINTIKLSFRARWTQVLLIRLYLTLTRNIIQLKTICIFLICQCPNEATLHNAKPKCMYTVLYQVNHKDIDTMLLKGPLYRFTCTLPLTII